MNTGRRPFDLDALVDRLLDEGTPTTRDAAGNTPAERRGRAARQAAAPDADHLAALGRRALAEIRLPAETVAAARRAVNRAVTGVFPAVYKHPLTAARAALGLSASQYLKRVDHIHRQPGFGVIACRREKVCRWEAGIWAPERTVQVAIATLHGVPYELLDEFPWPRWLLFAFPDDGNVLSTPWTVRGTVAAMASCVQGGAVDRRGFLIATGATLGTIAADWSGALSGVAQAATVDAGAAEALSAVAEGRARRLTLEMVATIERRLDALRHLDDVMGGGELCRLAREEFELLSRLADEANYDEATGKRLFSAVAEAARICGWVHHDNGLNAAAQKYFVTGLRASATAGDVAVGAGILSYLGRQAYTVGDPQDAVALLEAAQGQTRNRLTPQAQAILHARTARAYAATSYGRYAAARELEKARDALAKGPHDDDPPWSYWLTPWELEMMAGSAALALGDPRRALRFFATARSMGSSADTYVRADAVYLVRIAKTHLILGEIDEACGVARQALTKGRSVNSVQYSDALADFRTRLQADHRGSRAAKEFLDLTTA